MFRRLMMSAALMVAVGAGGLVADPAWAHGHGGFHGGGFHGGGFHGGGFHGGFHHFHGGFGPGFYVWPYFESYPFYEEDCGWVRVAYRRHHRLYVRRVWQCW